MFHNAIILASLTADQMRIKHWWKDTDKGNLKHWETNMTCPIAILRITNSTWSGLGLNVGLWILKSWFLDRQNCDDDKGDEFSLLLSVFCNIRHLPRAVKSSDGNSQTKQIGLIFSPHYTRTVLVILTSPL